MTDVPSEETLQPFRDALAADDEDIDYVGHPEWHGPMWNDCGACNFRRRTGISKYCTWCVSNLSQRLATLAANLATAGALCASFEMGRDAGPGQHVPFKTSWWRPGCGKPWQWPHVTRDDGCGRSAP